MVRNFLIPRAMPWALEKMPFQGATVEKLPFQDAAVEKLPFQGAGCVVVCTFALIPKHIPLVIFNIIQFQKLPVFILK